MPSRPFKIGHRLEDFPVLGKSHTRRVRALGIATLEELHDFVAQSQLPGAPFNAEDVLDVSHVGKLQQEIAAALSPERGGGLEAKAGASERTRRAASGKEAARGPAFDLGSSGFAGRYRTGALAPTQRFMFQKAEEGVASLDGPGSERQPAIRADLSDEFGPVRDQGDRGTCVAHSTVALMEHLWKKNRKQMVDLSEQFLYWNSKRQDNAPQASGTYQRIAVALLVAEGVCKEKTWSYNRKHDPDNEGQGPPPNRPQESEEARRHRPTQGIARDPLSSAVIQELLDDDTPVSVSVPVYTSWWGQTTQLYGQIPMPRPGELPESGHAICLVGYGYDPDFAGGGFFIVRNSWGTGWAAQSPFEPGYGSIPFSYIDHYNWESFCLA